jgi:hypothetical protein
MALTFALIAPVRPVLHRVSCSKEMTPNAPKHYETHQNLSLGSNGLDRVHLLRIITIWFIARMFALIALVQPVLTWVHCRNETIPNEPQHYKPRQNKSLGSYGLDRVCSLRNILTRRCGTNFCTNCTSLAHFHQISCNNKMVLNAPKQYKTQQKHEFRIQWGWNGCVRCEKFRRDLGWIGCARCEKFWRDIVAWTFALMAQV